MAVERNIRGETVPEPVMFRPIGGAPPVPIQGLEGILSTMAGAVQELGNIRRDLTIMVKRDTESQRSVADALTQAVERHAALLEEQIKMQQGGRTPTSVSSGGAISTSRMGDGGRAAPDRVQSSEATQDPDGWKIYTSTRDRMSVGGIRQSMGQALERRLDNYQAGGQVLTQDNQGNWVDVLTGDYASPAEVEAFRQRETIAGALRGGAQALSQGQPVRQAAARALGGSSLGQTLLRGAGWVSAGIMAAGQITDFFESQRAQNAEFQRIMGGTNLEGAAERGRMKAFTFGRTGTMGAADAEALFKGVAATGLQGTDRTLAQDFILENYTQLGMTVQESLRVVQTAAKTGQESLYGLAGALRQVTEDAREAGINTSVARERFIQTWTQMSEFLGGGQAAVSTAMGLSRAVTSMGRAYQGAGVGNLSMMDLRVLGARRGMSLNEMLIQSMNDPGFIPGAIGQDAQSIVRQFFKPGGLQALQAAAQGLPDGPLNAADRERLALVYLNSTADIETAVSVVDSQVPGLDLRSMPLDAQAAMLAEIALGRFDPAGEAAKAQAEMQPYEVTRETTTSPYGTGEILRTRSGEMIQQVGAQAGRVGAAWQRGVKTTGMAGGIAEAIVRDRGLSKGIEQVKIGNEVMTLERALEFYQADVNKGEAEIVAGASDLVGRTVGEVTGQGVGGGVTGEQGSVVIGLTPEAKRILTVENTRGKTRYDENWAPHDPHVSPSDMPTGR